MLRRNWFHQNLPDEEMRDIPEPWNEMQLHISFKFAQVRSIAVPQRGTQGGAKMGPQSLFHSSTYDLRQLTLKRKQKPPETTRNHQIRCLTLPDLA